MNAGASVRLRVVPDPPNRKKQDLATVAGRIRYFEQALREQELSPATIKGYSMHVKQMEWFCGQAGYTLRNVPAIVLAQYVETRPKTYSTRLFTRAAAKSYWAVFKRQNPPLWVLKVPRRPARVCRALSEQDARRLAEAARARGDRQGLAVLFGLYMAFRRQEIADVRWADIRDDGWIDLIGKGGLAARLPLHPVVKDALAALDHDADDIWVFPARQDRTRRTVGHVAPATVWIWVTDLARQVGLSVTTHQLRHTALATANDNTGDIRAVQSFARHSKLDTTSGYTRTTERRLHAVIAAIDYEEGAAERIVIEQRITSKLAGLSGADLVRIDAAVEELVGLS